MRARIGDCYVRVATNSHVKYPAKHIVSVYPRNRQPEQTSRDVD